MCRDEQPDNLVQEGGLSRSPDPADHDDLVCFEIPADRLEVLLPFPAGIEWLAAPPRVSGLQTVQRAWSHQYVGL